MNYASVCSGVESASLAWEPLGWKPVWFSEIEAFPSAVLATRFPNVPNLGDMTKIKGEEYDGAVDLLVGGTPCQGFSVAGRQGGLDDPRSVLCLTYVGLLKTMRPTWFVWENVPGVFSTADGEDFRSFIRAIDEIGYSCAWRVLDAQYVRVDGYPRAVPQRRRRVFVVGHISGDWRYPASVLFEPDSVQRDTPPRRIKGQGFAGDAENRIGTASGRLWDPSGGRNADGVVMSIGNGQVDTAMRPNQEFSNTLHCMHDHEIILDGRDVVCLNDQGGSMMKIEKDATVGTLRANAHGNEPIICVHGSQDPITNTDHANAVNRNNGLENCVCYENHAQDSRVKSLDGVCSQISAKAGTGGNNLPLVQTNSCYPINSMVIGKDIKDGDRQTTGIGNDGEPCPTLQAAHHHAVAIAENIIGRKIENGGNEIGAQEELAYTQNTCGVMGVAQGCDAYNHQLTGDVAVTINANSCNSATHAGPSIINSSTVRRLLPVECERLMGFPEVNVLEIGRMTKDEFIAWEIAVENITVDTENGLVYSTRTSGGRKSESPILLEGTETPTGYLVVSLREKEDKRQCRVHRIIWIAEHGVPPEGMTIDHINNDKKDNRLVNLQLMTSIENSSKAHADGLVKHKTKISDEQKNEIITLYQEHEIPIRKLATMFGISKSRVHQLIHSTGWTRIPWKGKPEGDCPDSPRYKACGNSMCVNVMRWIGMRIEMVERKTIKEME